MNRLYEYYDLTAASGLGGSDYLTSGFPSIFHYDPSTFYNYTQDNFYLTGIEGRQTYLSQEEGFPGTTPYSSVVLTVSAGFNGYDKDFYYNTVQEAVDSLPTKLTYPVLIEVCDYGHLGSLTIENIKCSGKGALQITVLNQASDVDGVCLIAESYDIIEEATGTEGRFTYGKKPVYQTYISSSCSGNMVNTSNTRKNDSTFDVVEWAACSLTFGAPSPNSQREMQVMSFADARNPDTSGGSVYAPTPAYTWSSLGTFGAPVMTLNNYDWVSRYDKSVSADFSAVTQNSAKPLVIDYRPVPTERPNNRADWPFTYNPAYGTPVSLATYGAQFSSINIRDCNRVKLKGVCVDGSVIYEQVAAGSAKYVKYDQPIGIDIERSNVLLEDCAVSRCAKVGIKAFNSTINVSKSFIVYRIYDKYGYGNNFYASVRGRGTGVSLTNSNLVFSDNELSVSGAIRNLVSYGPVPDVTERSGRYLKNISHCGVGLESLNSFVGGGQRDTSEGGLNYCRNAGDVDTVTSHFSLSNCLSGMVLNSSVFDFDGRLNVFLNGKGVTASQSKISLSQFSVDDNQEEGFLLEETLFYYGKNAESINSLGGFSGGYEGMNVITGEVTSQPSTSNAPLFQCDFNGINLKAVKNSTVEVHPDVGTFSSLGMWGGNTAYDCTGSVSANVLMRNHGVIGDKDVRDFAVSGYAQAPAIFLNENTQAELVGLGYASDGASGALVLKGGCALVSDNSLLRLVGFKDRWTVATAYGFPEILGHLKYNWQSTPFYAENNSTIEFVGPTKISKHGVDVICTDNSHAYFGTPLDKGYNLFGNREKYGLQDSENHTKVELHSTRACVVADDASKVTFYGMGASAATSSTAADNAPNTLFYELTKGGYTIFYPNGFTENSFIESVSSLDARKIFTMDRTHGFAKDMSLTANHTGDNLGHIHTKGSTGGMCVRVVDNSEVTVDLVNFAFAIRPEDVSGVVYNWYGSGTEFINNADFCAPLSPKTDRCWIVEECCRGETVQHLLPGPDIPTVTTATTTSTKTSFTTTTTTTTPTSNTTTTTTATTTDTTSTSTETTTTATTTTATTTTATTSTSTTATTTTTTATTTTDTTTTATTTTATTSTTTATTSTSTTATTTTTTATTSTSTTATTTTSTATTSTSTTATTTTTTATTSTSTTATTTTTTATTSTSTTATTTTSTTSTSTSTTSTSTTDTTQTSTSVTSTSSTSTTSTSTTSTSTTATTSTSTSTTATTTTSTTSTSTSTTSTSTTATTSTSTTATTTTTTATSTSVTTTTSTSTTSTSTTFTATTSTSTTSTSTTSTNTTATTTTATTTTATTTTLTNTTSTSTTATTTTATTTTFTATTSTSTTATTTTSTATPPTTTTATVTTATTLTPPPTTTTPTLTTTTTVTSTTATTGPCPPYETVNRDPTCLPGPQSDYSSIGSRINIWNVCDTSKMRVSNVFINGNDPETECVNYNWHGPIGRWYTGAACDYYGKFGLAAVNEWDTNTFYNYGIFRLMTGGRGSLKTLYDVDYSYLGMSGVDVKYQASAGGNTTDQLTAQGYQAATDLAKTLGDSGEDAPNSDPVTRLCDIPEDEVIFWQQKTLGFGQGQGGGQQTASGYEQQFGRGLAGFWREPGKINGMWTHAHITQGSNMLWAMGQLHPEFAVPPLHAKWDGYLDNYVDESAMSLFANTRHGANKKVGLCSIYKSYTPYNSGGEGRDGMTTSAETQNENTWKTFGLGVRSLNIFDLAQLV